MNHSLWQELETRLRRHDWVVYAKPPLGGPACVKLAQFRAVNTLLGNLKTTLSGTCHAFDFSKYSHRSLAEFQYRFNRRFDLSVILVRLLRASAVTSPHPERVIRAG